MKNRKLYVLLISLLFLLLGASLGASLTTFFFFLDTHIDSLMIFSYTCVLVFIVLLIAMIFIVYRNKNTFTSNGVDNYEKQD